VVDLDCIISPGLGTDVVARIFPRWFRAQTLPAVRLPAERISTLARANTGRDPVAHVHVGARFIAPWVGASHRPIWGGSAFLANDKSIYKIQGVRLGFSPGLGTDIVARNFMQWFRAQTLPAVRLPAERISTLARANTGRDPVAHVHVGARFIAP